MGEERFFEEGVFELSFDVFGLVEWEIIKIIFFLKY